MLLDKLGLKKEKAEHYTDVTFWFVLLFLLGFGLVMIYSASSYTAFSEHNQNAAYYLERQAFAVVLGLIAMVVVSVIPYHFWERFAMLGLAVSILMIFMVLSPLGVESHGARRWIGIKGTAFNIQPAEVAKVAIILLMAVMVCKMGASLKTLKGTVIFLLPAAVVGILIWQVTDNLSSALIVVAIAAIIFFVARPDYKLFVGLVAAAIVGVTVLLVVITNTDVMTGFRSGRIRVWLDPESDAEGVGFQTIQALYAIGSGGIWGKGLGESMQKLSFIPESQNDMIFSIICEELGLFGAAAIIFMFIVLIWRMVIIANNAPDLFGGMLVVGVIGHIAVQAILNIAVVTNTIPNTGISLPFISYGGSSVIFLLIEIGLVLSVARSIEFRD